MTAKALAAFCAVPFLVSADLPPHSSLINDGYPPARFMGEAPAIVLFVNDVGAICGQAPPGYVFEACASKEQHKIAMPNPCSARFQGEQFAKIMCHEKGHLLGWPNTHGD